MFIRKGNKLRVLQVEILIFWFCLISVGAVAQASEDSKASSQITIGEKEENRENLIEVSLRKESSLLRKGQKQIEVGIDYRRYKSEIPTLFEDNERNLQLSLLFRLGVWDKLDLFVTVPFISSYREVIDENGRASDHTHAVGDLNAGLSKQLLAENSNWPEIIGTLSYIEPTGVDPYDRDLAAADTGNGHRKIGTSLQFIKTSDPIVYFLGINYTHSLETTVAGQDLQPGDVFEFNYGLSFAANDNLSFSWQAIGSYEGEIQIDGQRVEGTTSEPYYLRFAITTRYHFVGFIEPFVTMGLNNDADFYSFGVAFIYRWD